jgi:hypothetical protein
VTEPIRRLVIVLLVGALMLAAWPAAAAPQPPAPGRARQLERAALDLAVRLRAVPVRDGGFADPGRYCPAGRLAVSFTPPAGAFRFGAYVPPLGPAPGAATTRVNGVVTCRGATYAYMGFEARWTGGGWQVVDVPALDEPADAPASRRPARSAAATALAPPLPVVQTGPLDDLAPYQPQATCTPWAKAGVVGSRGSSWPRSPRPATPASRGPARSAAPASTRRAGPGTGPSRSPAPTTSPPPARSSPGCSAPTRAAAAGRWPGVWA